MKIIKWILTVLTVLSTVIMLFVFPDEIPVHFDINGVADRWGSKYEMLVLPIMAIVVVIMFEGISRYYYKRSLSFSDEKSKAEALTNCKVIYITNVIMSVVFFVLNAVTLYSSYKQTYPEKDLPEFDMIGAISIIMGVVFIVTANYMPKTRRNSTIGFRLPWTLYNDETWRKSNKFASYVMMAAGAITILGAFFLKGISSSILMLTVVFISLVIIMIYAYIIYREERKKDNEESDKG